MKVCSLTLLLLITFLSNRSRASALAEVVVAARMDEPREEKGTHFLTQIRADGLTARTGLLLDALQAPTERPSTMICCCFSSFKTLLMAREPKRLHYAVNVSNASTVGRF